MKVSPEHRPGEQAGLSQDGGFLAATSGVVATAVDLESSMPTYPLTIGTGGALPRDTTGRTPTDSVWDLL